MDNSGIDVIGVVITLVFVAATYLWVSLAVAAVLGKAGRETWPAWIPVYNTMVLFGLAGMSPLLGLLMLLVPIQTLVWLFLGLKLSPKFGMAPAWGILAFLAPQIWLSVLGWGTARWMGDEQPASNSAWGYAQPAGNEHPFGAAPAAGYDANGYPLSPTASAAPADGTAWDAQTGIAPSWLAPADESRAAQQATPAWPAAASWATAEPAAPLNEATAAASWPGATPAAAWPAPAPEAPAAPAWPVADAAPAWPAPTSTSASTHDLAGAVTDSGAAWPVAPNAPIAPSASTEPSAPITPVAPSASAAPIAPSAADVGHVTDPWAPAPPARTAETAVPEAPVPPIIDSPFTPPVQPISTSAVYPTGDLSHTGESSLPSSRGGATRMREDSEVVAQARAASVPPRIDEPMAQPPIAEVAAGPIIVPGASGQLPGVVPPPPIPPITRAAAARTASGGDSNWPGRLRRDRLEDTDDLSMDDLSAEVSAVAGAPSAGQPRSAMAAVSAQSDDAVDDDDDDFEETVLAVRRRPVWRLQLPMSSRPIDVTATTVLLGRKPSALGAPTDAQLVPVADGTRTVSKTHARLDLVDQRWMITDLGSTNGIVLIGDNGEENELASHVTTPLTERFLLGDAEFSLTSQQS